MSAGPEYLEVCRYCGGAMHIDKARNRWAVKGDEGQPCSQSVAAGYPAHCPTPRWAVPVAN